MGGCSRCQNPLDSERGAPPAQSEILLPLGGKHPPACAAAQQAGFSPNLLLLLFGSATNFQKGVRSKRKGQPSQVLPRISNDEMQNSKGKPTFLSHASDSLSGSAFRASMIWDAPIVSHLPVNRDALHSTNDLISYRIRRFDNLHILVRIPNMKRSTGYSGNCHHT